MRVERKTNKIQYQEKQEERRNEQTNIKHSVKQQGDQWLTLNNLQNVQRLDNRECIAGDTPFDKGLLLKFQYSPFSIHLQLASTHEN